MIFGADDQQILALLADYSIDAAHLEVGKALYAAVIDLDDVRQVEWDDEQEASDAWKLAYEEQVTFYRKVRKLVKPFAQAQPGMAKKLHLLGTMPRAQLKMIRHMDMVYKALVRHPEFLASLAVSWLTAEMLVARSAAVNALPAIQMDYKDEALETMEATRIRNVKYTELKEYSKLLRAKALIALEDHPHLLGKMGLA